MKKSSIVMKRAHILFKSDNEGRILATNVEHKPVLRNWSNCVKHAWYFEHFRQWLGKGLVTFTYMKKDNSFRYALGTLCDVLIPSDKRPKGKYDEKKRNVAIINYFDIQKQEWRSFDIRQFIGFVTRFEHLK